MALALAASLQDSTLRHYNGYLLRFERFCARHGLQSWRQASLAHVLGFLCDVAAGLQRPSASLDTAVAALRAAFSVTASSPLESPLVPRVRKGLVVLGTTRPRSPTEPIPIAPLRAWLLSLPPLGSLSYADLRMKCAVIAAMVLIARPSDLAALSMGGLTFARDLSTMRVDLLGFKNDYRREGAVLNVQACSDQRLCFIRAARALVDANRSRWPAASALFLHSRSGAPLSAERISAVLRGACKLAGLPDTFSGRNFRPGGATRGIEGNLPLDLVMHIGRWRDYGTVYGHYLRSATTANTTDVLLGVGRSDPALDAT